MLISVWNVYKLSILINCATTVIKIFYFHVYVPNNIWKILMTLYFFIATVSEIWTYIN